MAERRKSKFGGWLTMGVLLGLGALSICFKPFAPIAKQSLTMRRDLTEQEMRRVTVALHHYRAVAGCYPSAEQGLRVLVSEPNVEPLPKKWEQIFGEVPRDGWGRPLGYSEEEGRARLRSAGADGEFGTDDDLMGRSFEQRTGKEMPTTDKKH